MSNWTPIEPPPENRKIIVHYINELGRDRTVFAINATRGAIEITDDSDDYEDVDGRLCLPAGWYEIIESPYADFCFVGLGGDPDYWQPLPENPR